MEAVSHATGIIASCARKNSAFALDLEVRTRAASGRGKGLSFRGCRVSQQVRKSVDGARKFFKLRGGIRIEIDNEIPPKAGLGEDEAIAVSSALALAGLAADKDGSVMELQIDKFLRTQVIDVNGKFLNKKELIEILSVDGMNYARLCASLFGGFFVTENKKILRRGELEDLDAVVLTPKKNNPTNIEMDLAWQEALKGNLYQAMKLNSSFCGNDELMQRILRTGALTVASSDGSVIGLVRGGNSGKVANSIKRDGKIIKTRILNNESRILQKPKKILRINEFMKLKGEQEFYFL